ncbi:MAG: transporter [Deltaproteobacteria bacterium]|jgi:MFS family permease|nr:transporter [Deltaproteobacteria bacterium]
MSRNSPIFYGWYLVAICIISMILIYGIRHSFAVFFSPILEEFRWSRGDIAMMMSLNILIYGFLAPLAGGLADRWRPRVLIPIGIIILGVATAGCAFATRLWHFYFLFGFLMSIGSAFSGWPIFAPALMNWFTKRRGLVLGLGQMGGGLSFVYSIFVEFTIRNLGWRHAFLALSFILMASLLPLLFWLFFYRPQDKGMTAYGAEDFQPPQPQPWVERKRERSVPPLGGGLREVLKTQQLWFLVASYALYWGIAGYMVMAHQVRFLQDKGFSSVFSASIFALLGIMIFLGQLSAFLSDWLGREKTHSLATCLSIGGLGALLGVNDTSQVWLLYTFAVLFGYGGGLATPVTYAASADIFHGRHFGMVGGLLLGGMGVGSVLGPWLGGYLFDISGSYKFSFVFSMISLVFSSLFLWFAAPRKAVLTDPFPKK